MMSRHILRRLSRPQSRPTRTNCTCSTPSRSPRIRHASNKASPSKPIVLEQPDRFRPPSHPQRIPSSRSPRLQGAYNQSATAGEREAQKTRKYPHMFPTEGTTMHWFLTNRAIHLWITMGTLSFLATISLTQSFLQTSPYAHLIPPISSLPFHPLAYIRETVAVVRLHIEYNSAQTAESRRKNILDAQKRRLYRRAHGMEDLNAEEDQGVDVRGLVPWDDGLTNPERARGGRSGPVTGRMVVEAGGEVGEDLDDFVDRQNKQKESDGAGEPELEPAAPKRKKVKRWLGIWE